MLADDMSSVEMEKLGYESYGKTELFLKWKFCGPNLKGLLISSKPYLYGEPTSARASPYLKNRTLAGRNSNIQKL